MISIRQGDALDVLRELEAGSAHSLVTDPPAGIEFLGKAWDGDRGGRAQWIAWLAAILTEARRVLRPGSHALVWALPRTAHWTMTALEDAGFEIRDVVVHVFGQGFPKSLDVAKAIDRQRHDGAQVRQVTAWLAAARDAAGLTNAELDAVFGFNGMAGHWTSQGSQAAVPTLEHVPALLTALGVDEVPEPVRTLLLELNGRKGQPGEDWFRRPVLGAKTVPDARHSRPHFAGLTADDGASRARVVDVTAPASEASAQWAGWGTALKPAAEHWILARVPLAGTVASNVRDHGVGALNIDGCRIACEGGSPAAAVRELARKRGRGPGRPGLYDPSRIVSRVSDERFMEAREGEALGRWPANVCFSEDAARDLDAQSGTSGGAAARASGKRNARRPAAGLAIGQGPYAVSAPDSYGDRGGASRFFYCPKASRSEKGEGNTHPTVKSLELMRWLVRLVTPPGGTVLDPFAGSGSTVLACLAEGTFNCVAVERDGDYASTALRRAQAIAPLFHGVPAPGGSGV